MQSKCIIVVLALLLGISSTARAELEIVTTTSSLAALCQAVAGKQAKVTSLSLHTQDPHWVDARPNLALELSKADLLVLVGLGLEAGWLPTLLTASRNGDIQKGGKGYLDASTLVSLLEKTSGTVDRSMGDIHPGGNPHYLYDPRRAARVAEGVAKRLAALDPKNAGSYTANAKTFTNTLGKWQKHWEAELGFLRGRKLIGYHKSLSYLADWLGFEVIVHLEPRPGIAPNPGHVARVIELGKQRQVRLLIQESFYPANTSELVAKKMGAKLAVIPGGANFRGGESYIGFVNEVATRLKARGR